MSWLKAALSIFIEFDNSFQLTSIFTLEHDEHVHSSDLGRILAVARGLSKKIDHLS